MLGIPFYVLNFQEDFGRVIDYFVAEYNRGRTPNPCVRCNDWLKFGKLRNTPRRSARITWPAGTTPAPRATRSQAGGDCSAGSITRRTRATSCSGCHAPRLITRCCRSAASKSTRCAIAEDLKLPVFNKPDSQEICFVPNKDYAGLVRRRSPADAFRAGEFVTAAGEPVGSHAGHQQFTIGQRKGLGIALGHPVYVVDIDAGASRVTLGAKEALLKDSLTARQVNLLSASLREGSGRVRCTAKIRYNHQPQPAWARSAAPTN